jgi:putative endonuclease
MPAWFYILRLKSTRPYCGSTKDKVRRSREHFAGLGGRTTKLDPPLAVVYEEEYETYREAFRREHQVKRWVRAKKEALIRGDLIELKRLSKRRKR